VFGLSFGELLVLLVVAMVVLGPKELPRYLRKAGQFAGRLRRLAYDMREKSGIDEVLRTEGIDRDIAEIRRLARGEIGGVTSALRSTTDALRAPLGGTVAAATSSPATSSPAAPAAAGASAPAASSTAPAVPVPAAYAPTQLPDPSIIVVEREREYPREGADSYGALPDTAIVYDGALPASPLADDALYTRGEAA
jgi:sec-independent protein translocase protein TatB